MNSDTEVEAKVTADAALVATLEIKPKRKHTKKVKVEEKPADIILARSHHGDQVYEITVPAPPERPKVETKITYHRKLVTIQKANEEKKLPELKIERQFGPYTSLNRAQRRKLLAIVKKLRKIQARKAKHLKPEPEPEPTEEAA